GRAAHRVQRVEQAGVLHQEEGSMARREEAAADRDTLVLLTHLHDSHLRVLQEALEQVVAGRPVWQGRYEAGAGALDLADDLVGPQYVSVLQRRTLLEESARGADGPRDRRLPPRGAGSPRPRTGSLHGGRTRNGAIIVPTPPS